MAEPRARTRRLPTKTSSGIISLPPGSTQATITEYGASKLGSRPVQDVPDMLDDEDELLMAAAAASAAKSSPRASPQPDAAEASAPAPPAPAPSQAPQPVAALADAGTGTGPGAEQCPEVHADQPAVGSTASSLPPPRQSQPQEPAPSSSEAGGGFVAPSKPIPPRPSSRSRPAIGPLNASTAPAVVSLPVMRRGSFTYLKRHSNSVKSEDKPSVLSLMKKPTHWERFGTILVLYCAKSKCLEDGLLQIMMAEGYDTEVVESQPDAILAFTGKDVFPDMVVVDADHSYNTLQLIKQLQAQNPTVAIIVIGSSHTRPNAVTALQAGASDYMRQPVDPDELVARIERHVQRQHCIKLELEKALEDVKDMMSQLAPASMLNDMVMNNRDGKTGAGGGKGHALVAVAETDFEEQMSELSEENQRLGAKLAEMERILVLKDQQNRALETKLNQLDIHTGSTQERLDRLEDKLDSLLQDKAPGSWERMSSSGCGASGSGNSGGL